MGKVKKKAESKELVPIYGLKAMFIDSFTLQNAKHIQNSLNIKLLDVPNLSINMKGGSGCVLIDDLKTIQIIQIIEIGTPFQNDIIDLCRMEVSFDFSIENYDLFRPSENEFTFSTPFLNQLSNISLSTCRGLLASKLSNTFLQALMIPIIFQKSINLSSIAIMKKGQIADAQSKLITTN